MSSITIAATAATMTSQEIAALVGSRHEEVRRSIERLAERGVISLPPMAEVKVQRERRAETVKAYVFEGAQGRRDSIVVVAQLSPEFTARLVDRWQELEAAAAAPAIPKTLPEALRLAAEAIERNQVLEIENKAKSEALAVAEPKALALDRIARETEGAVCLRVTAKLMQVPEKLFLQFLQSEGWIFRHHHSRTWTGYSEKEKAGYLELKRTRILLDDGSERTVEQVLVTPRGQAKAAELIERKAPWLRKVVNDPSRLDESSLKGAH